MSSLRSTIEHLRRDVDAAPLSVFERGRQAHAVLQWHTTPASVLVALSDESEHTWPARDALTRSLLAMHRVGGSPLWSSMLAVAFFPMLSRLRHRIVGDAIPREELDQLVLACFWSALAELPVSGHGSDRLPMRLRQRTQRLVFQALRKEREQQHESLDDNNNALERYEAPTADRITRVAGEERIDLALLLEKAAEDGVPRASLEIIAATVLRRELLRNYVTRVGPADPLERERLYQRLKRQRSRVLGRLRGLLNAPRPEC